MLLSIILSIIEWKRFIYLLTNWQTARLERRLSDVFLSQHSFHYCPVHVSMRSSSKKMSYSFCQWLSPLLPRRNYHKRRLTCNSVHRVFNTSHYILFDIFIFWEENGIFTHTRHNVLDASESFWFFYLDFFSSQNFLSLSKLISLLLFK